MINIYNQDQFEKYNSARNYFLNNYQYLVEVEKFLTLNLYKLVVDNLEEIKSDYNEASYLYPFWSNYPPEDRGNKPVGDQYPWIEVGEHAIGCKLPRLLDRIFKVRDVGFPTGADQRFLVSSDHIATITNGYTDSAWFFIDVKSVGPRDDQSHTVMSHNQVSGDGSWLSIDDGVRNSIIKAVGPRASHDFHASLPPIFVLSDGTIAPLVTVALKPVYKMLPLNRDSARNSGQPLERIDIACIPNGILLAGNPNYLKSYRGLLFPGKDDKSKDPRKLRARVSFDILNKIASWRIQSIHVPFP